MNQEKIPTKKTLMSILMPYRGLIILLVIFTLVGNTINLLIPKIISNGIDSYSGVDFSLMNVVIEFFFASLFIFIFLYFQNLLQVYISEKVAKNLRTQMIEKISYEDYNYVQKVTQAKLLTNLTSDVDGVKMFVSQAISSIISSIFLIIGTSILLFSINWELTLAILLVLPIIGGAFFIVFGKVRVLFKINQENIDRLNKTINESILGSTLVRILNSQAFEYDKFLEINEKTKQNSLKILRLFAILMPVITFTVNIAILIILMLGGHYVIIESMTLGDFTAFNTYLSILIFPVMILGFMSSLIAQATASFERISEVLYLDNKKITGTIKKDMTGDIKVANLNLQFGDKMTLKNINFSIKPHSKTAIIGPTAAGKSQLLYILTGLLEPTSGSVKYENIELKDFDRESLSSQVGFVFQDSNLFQLTLRENIAFSPDVSDEDLQKAIETSELKNFIETLPEKLDTLVSERGTSLSGGQKQRIMLARALSIHPKILFLDDFTARLDAKTEKKILENISKNYPDITIISVTQKIDPIKNYDQIILIMEGEILAIGTHEELMSKVPEYVQIYNSQLSTNNYELQA
ncbi:MAG: ABC transporter ATP-binding protein [Candidatus Altimarinota bacterium]